MFRSTVSILPFARLLLLWIGLGWFCARGIEPAAAVVRGREVALAFGANGRPLSFTRGDGPNLIHPKEPGPGFSVSWAAGAEEKVVPLDSLIVRDGKWVLSGADGACVTLAVTAGQTHVAVRLEKVENLPLERNPALHLRADFNNVNPVVVPLDYMTESRGEWAARRGLVMVSWPHLGLRGEDDPLGGFAFFVPRDDEDHNESLLRIWTGEGLPHPKVDGAWTLDRARQWVRDWREAFPRGDQLTITARNPGDLDVLVDYAKQLRVHRLYLHTDTWRGAYWVYDRDPLHVNTNVFPRGEADLRAFQQRLRADGMDAMLHTICYGFGAEGSKYVGKTTDRRLANWGRGRLEQAVSATDTTFLFRPDPGVVYPLDAAGAPRPDGSTRRSFGGWWKFQDVLIGDEIVRCTFTRTDEAVWTLTPARRGPRAAAHAAGTEVIGLLKAYDQNYYPDSRTTLCEETAREYADFFNRLGIRHHEFDGGECHDDVPWGYRKWTMHVYRHTDHPVTSNASNGLPNPWDLVYRFKAGGGTFLSQRGGGMASLFLHEPRRPATGPIENHFTLARGAAANGTAFNFLKPEPMFGITPEAIRGHGLAPLIAEQFATWREVAGHLTPEQRKMIAGAYYHDASPLPLDAGHPVGRTVFSARRTEGGFELQPFQVLVRGPEDVEWKTVQEFGPVLPRQHVRPGDRLRLENPYARQTPHFIARVMPGFREGAPGAPAAAAEANRDLAGYLQASGAREQAPAAPGHSAGLDNRLQPTAAHVQAAGRHEFRDDGAVLRLSFDNTQGEEHFQLEGLPHWRVKGDSRNARALAVTVTGDGSGAFLVIQTSKDYVIPIDFDGRRDIVIPCGEAAWAVGRWGLRYSSKGAHYGPINRVAMGFGRVPKHTVARVAVENLRLLAEEPSALENPVVRAGAGTLAIQGVVRSDEILWYQGGDHVLVHDLNWQPRARLPVVSTDFSVDPGFSDFSIEGRGPAPAPWLDVQFICHGEPQAVTVAPAQATGP